MIEIRKPANRPTVTIRVASSQELYNYENRKLVNIDKKAKENKNGIIKINDQIVPLHTEALISLDNLTFNNRVRNAEFSANEFLFVKHENIID